MENIEIKVGMLLAMTSDNIMWRIICIINKICRMINTSGSKLDFMDINYTDISQGIIKGQIKIITDEDLVVFDIDALSPCVKADFLKKREFIRAIDKAFGPTYEMMKYHIRKEEYEEALLKHGITRSTGQRVIVRWLQSGFQEKSLLNTKLLPNTDHKKYEYSRKTGRPSKSEQGIIIDEQCRIAFDYGVNLYKKKRMITIRDCYAMLCAEYYSENIDNRIILLPVNQRPTEHQFRTYLNNQLTTEQKRIIKTSVEEFRNNERLQFSSPTIEALRPGFIVEADALEVDLELVSSIDETKIVGRPILYMMIDIYSHCIVAFSVSFENNSMIGLSNLMINLFESKKAFAEKHNIMNFNPELWPSNFIPNEIRCDRGSDFKSKGFEEICRELNINITLEPGGMGSMKGSIEQSFRLFHQTFKAELENKGYIQKRYDSKHKTSACLTIEEVIKLATLFVLYHNGQYSKKFKITPDMVKSGVVKTPVSIWNYGVKKWGMQNPVPESKLKEVMYKLMIDDTASISKQGVFYKGLYYLPFGDAKLKEKMMLSSANAKRRDTNGDLYNSLRIKKDPRLVNYLYYRNDDGVVMQLFLNSAKSNGVRDISWNEYDEYYKFLKDMDGEKAPLVLQRMVDRQQNVKIITESVRKVIGTPSSKGIRDTRHAEKEFTNTQNSVSERITETPPIAPVPSTTNEQESCSPSQDNIEKEDYPVSPLLSDEVPDFFLKH